MAEKTGIEWADATWNPWLGCHKVSAGCTNCYMFRDARGRDPKVVKRASLRTFASPLLWKRRGTLLPGAKIFTCSLSDWFIEEADQWRNEASSIIRATPDYTYLILTKRPERILEHLPEDWAVGYPNVWLLVSCEDQRTYLRRWRLLSYVPAVVKGVSAEPLLNYVDILDPSSQHGLPDWVIVGGESDRKTPRWTDPSWVRALIAQCHERSVACFVKQIGSKWAHAIRGTDWKGADPSEWPPDLRVREFPKPGGHNA